MYGQLKTIGTSPKQIRYMIIRQGSILSLVGIPAGLVLGWLLGNGLLPLVMASTNFAETEFIVPPWWIWLLAALFTFVTVRISQLQRPRKDCRKNFSCGSIENIRAVCKISRPTEEEKKPVFRWGPWRWPI